ncbi:MAG: hypothetical protein A2275_16455 [Bacteroidetes bacterium RIFOXYA12_FULL_35_11]|nr:MAG: hypothetical protein A2X01_01335 [Bacteroidetes bacterium GWF2_35_48]OFY80597.1 MAG: hypothetical protein A2275_16455 [Bacteroidetes bacterium RIFOXYA12_FULL_35_11]OFZ02311.1 MAG: hypothetical protein A2491_13800 [Bacteroidetes bacterium RIFOXYC12_FULL_35_7]HBX51220.1 thiamine monophosphate kinase [Bacteroidales bacterium]
MLNEKQSIQAICSILAKGGTQLNKPFEADCEIIEWGDKFLLFTIDGFSAEDKFRENDPFILGYNLSVAAISDVLACGGKPLYYSHSLVISKEWDEKFLNEFTKGIKHSLQKFKINFIGGDFGTAEQWSYTAVVLGETDKPLMRSGASEGDLLYLSGSIGAGNFEAMMNIYSDNKLLAPFLNTYKIKLIPRLAESAFIKKYASSCIDTSDGLCHSLIHLANCNQTGFLVENIPYHNIAQKAAKLLRKPVEMLMIAECGEYELLFTVPKKNEAEFLADTEKSFLKFYKIGVLTKDQNFLLKKEKNILDLNHFDISARDFNNVKDYINTLQNLLK